MTAILHAAELAHFASMAAFVGFAVTGVGAPRMIGGPWCNEEQLR
jgi:hypothetical protein